MLTRREMLAGSTTFAGSALSVDTVLAQASVDQIVAKKRAGAPSVPAIL